MKGLFITLEGSDGCGKSTITKLLTKYLKDEGYRVVTTREPGGTRISEIIRDIILDNRNTKMSPVTEALLYAASRAQHVEEIIIPALDKGKIVICERFVDSSLVYQGIGRNLGINKIRDINNFATQCIQPDLTLFFDISPEESISRRKHRKKKDRLERESIKFHKEVYQGYLKIIDMYKERIKIIDATDSLEDTFEQVQRAVTDKLKIIK